MKETKSRNIKENLEFSIEKTTANKFSDSDSC